MDEMNKLFSVKDLVDVQKYIKDNEREKPGYFVQVYITKVIYEDDVTVVFWSDGTKTITRCANGEAYNQEYALMLCVLKKLYPHKKLSRLLQCWTNSENNRGVITLKDVRKKEELISEGELR